MINFYKYSAIGNTFILTEDIVNKDSIKNILEDNLGLSSDGLIIVNKEDLSVTFYNKDSSIASMCGNGLRCVVSYFYMNNLISKNEIIKIKTKAGLMRGCINEDDSISIFFDDYSLHPKKIPVDCTKQRFIKEEIIVNSARYEISSMFVGNTQTVVFKNLSNLLVMEDIAKAISNSPIYFEGTNVNFVTVKDKDNIYVKTYEKGVGFTKSCGTGAVASAFFSYYFNKTNNNVFVHNDIGTSKVTINNDHIILSGHCNLICKGEIYV